MKASEMRAMTREELQHEITELRDEEFKLRLRRPTEDLPNALRLRTIRRDIARIQTILKEDKLGVISLPNQSARAVKKDADIKTKSEKAKISGKTTVKKVSGKKTSSAKSTSKSKAKSPVKDKEQQ